MAFDFQQKINTALEEGATPEEVRRMLRLRPDLQKLIPNEAGPMDYEPAVESATEPTGLLQRRADYERRKAAGTLNRNPFEGLSQSFEGLGQGLLNAGGFVYDSLALPGRKIKELGDWAVPKMAENRQRGLDIMFQNEPDRIYTEQEVKANNTPEKMKARVEKMKADEVTAQAREPTFLGDQAQKQIESGNFSENTEALPQDATPDQVADALTKDKAEDGKRAILNAGGSKEAVSAWEGFTDKVDLLTFGLSMMSLSGGQGTLTQNLAQSMQAGIDAKTAQGDKSRTQAREDIESSLDERKMRVEEQKADALDERNRITAQMALLKEVGAVQPEASIPSANSVTQTKTFLENKAKRFGPDLQIDPEAAMVFASQVETALGLPGATNIQDVMEQVYNATMAEESPWFGRNKMVLR